jgi:hypothetical protein
VQIRDRAQNCQTGARRDIHMARVTRGKRTRKRQAAYTRQVILPVLRLLHGQDHRFGARVDA